MPFLDALIVRSRPMMATLLMAAGAVSAQSTAAPATAPAAGTNDPVNAPQLSPGRQLFRLIHDPSVLGDPAKRQAIAPKALPLIHQMLAEAQPGVQPKLDLFTMDLFVWASALGDQQSTDQIKSMLASTDPSELLLGRITDLYTQWALAGTQVEAQNKVVDAFQRVADAYPDATGHTASGSLMYMAWERMGLSAASPDVKARLTKVLARTMQNSEAEAAQAQIKTYAAVERMKKNAVNKPFVVAGTTIDGATFTTADWKGKVVLIDFWATWCGPCCTELPHLQQLYSDHHAKGLEIVGVSNDSSAEALKTFIAKQHLPWPQLFDAAAASNQQLNSITVDYGIEGIPVLYLIDKKGVLRSVEAREELDTLLPKLLAE